MEKKISLIIVTYNSEAHIYECLNSVFKYNDIADKLEVVVVDNGSIEQKIMFSTINMIYNDKVQLIANSSNLGYGSGNNLGVKNTIADIILIMNPDIRLVQPVFLSIINEFNDNINYGMLGLKQYYSEFKAGLSYSLNYQHGPFQSIFLTVLYNTLNRYDYRKMYLSGAFFCIRRAVFESIGQFDERLFLYGEESDLHYRFRKVFPELKIGFRKDLKYLHLANDRALTLLDQKRMFESNIYFCKKNNIDVEKYIKKEIYKTYILIMILLSRFKWTNLKVLCNWVKFLKSH